MITCSGRSPRQPYARLLLCLLLGALSAFAQKPAPRIPGGSFTGSTPPDTMGAVGPNHLMVTVNSQVTFTDRSGNVISSQGIDLLWQNAGAGAPGDSSFDPSCLYDPYNNRFIMTTSANAQAANSCFFIGVTTTADPTGAWYAWKVPIDNAGLIWGDQPRVGFNKNWVLLTIDLFDMASNFKGSYVYAFRKSDLYAGVGRPGTPTVTKFQPPLVPIDIVAPAVTYDNNLAAEYVVRSNTASGSISLYEVTGAIGVETFSYVGEYASPLGGWAQFGPSGNQSGVAFTLDTGDDRIINAVYRNGSVWCAHGVGLPTVGANRSSAQWWQLSTASVGTVQQMGRIDDPSGASSYAYPSVAANALNDAVVGCSRFNSATHPSAMYAMRRHTDAAGTLRAPVVYQPGAATYTYGSDSSGVCRWGDYSASTVDPLNDTDLWTIQEYVASQDRWATAWSMIALAVAPPSAPGTPSADVNPNLGAFNVSWAAATDVSGPGLAGYLPQRSADGGATWTAFPLQAGTTLAQSGVAAGTYVYRVAAQDTAGTMGPWSSTSAAVTVNSSPTVPSLQSPANGAIVANSGVTLAWGASSASAGIQNYDVQVASSSTFSSIEWSATVTTNGATTSALVDGAHFWQARSRDILGNVSAWSGAWSFVVDTSTPVAPTASGPANGSTVTTARPILSWTAVSSPSGVTYQVEVAATNPIGAPLEASVSGLTSPSWPTLRLADGTHYWHVRAVNGAGTVGPWSATMSFTVNGKKGFYVGVGVGGHGDIAPFQGGTGSYAARPLTTVPWSAYDSSVGETRPAAGDLFGDGNTEVVVGLGRNGGAGWLVVLSDTGSGFTTLKWLLVPWAAYNAANGETFPACGDIDGDGRAEIVVGLGTYPSAGGYFLVFDDAVGNYAPRMWRQVNWPQYNAYDGQTRPAVGDLDGDGASEVLIGLGSYPGQGGSIYKYTDHTLTAAGNLQVNWAGYNASNGETWPACGDVNGDGVDEVCIGLGSSSGGWMQYLNNANAGFTSLAWKQLPWSGYDSASGETRPALGHLTGISGDQTVVGLGTNAGAQGYVAIFDRAPGFALLGWRLVSDSSYNSANGETRPTVGR